MLQRLPRMETPAPRTEKETKEMKQEHPIARFVGTIIGHLILVAMSITAITTEHHILVRRKLLLLRRGTSAHDEHPSSIGKEPTS